MRLVGMWQGAPTNPGSYTDLGLLARDSPSPLILASVVNFHPFVRLGKIISYSDYTIRVRCSNDILNLVFEPPLGSI